MGEEFQEKRWNRGRGSLSHKEVGPSDHGATKKAATDAVIAEQSSRSMKIAGSERFHH